MASNDYVVKRLSRALTLNLVEGFVEAMHEVGSKGSKQLKTLGESLAADAVPKSMITRVHADIGAKAQAKTVAAYKNRKGRRRVGSYRAGDRYANGKMEAALGRDGFYRATPKGLSIINRQTLSQEAAQWKRLNYGAGGGGGAAPEQFPIEEIGTMIGLPPNRQSAFTLPPGFWMKAGERVPPGRPGTAQFFARGRAQGSGARGRPDAARYTRGIRATNFLDAGVEVISKELIPAYLGMYGEFFNSKAGKTHFAKLKVNAPRPRFYL